MTDRIVIKCSDDRDVKARWKSLVIGLDHEADYEEAMDMILRYFEEGDGTFEGVRAANEGTHFR